MRYTLAFFFLINFYSQPVFSQNSVNGLIIHISAIECQQLLEEEATNLDFVADRPVVDTLKYGFDLNNLTYGHYLIVKAKGEVLTWNIYSRNQHQLYLHENNKQLNVSVVDELGVNVADASLRFEKRKMRFQDESQRYSNRRIRNGLLIAYLPGDTVFYKVKGLERKSIVQRRLNYFARSKVGYVITTPIRWIRGGVHYVKSGIRYGRWRIQRWPFQRLIQRIANSKGRNIKGYIASNQPVYRIGDTLKLTAYATTDKGRALQMPMRLKIHQNRQYVDTILTSTEDGRYSYDWVLGDSLRIDAGYSVSFASTKSNVHSYLQYRFRIEDYQLGEYKFEVLSNNPTFKAHEAVELTVKVSDTNGLAVAATTVNGYLLTSQITQLYTDSIRIPDTLWQFKEEMGGRTELSLFPPDSIWPAAITRANFHVHFQGPSGEISDQNTLVTVERPAWVPLLRLQGDSIHAFISGQNDELISKGKLVCKQGNSILDTINITPDTRVKLNPFAYNYTWTIGGKAVQLNLGYEDASVGVDYSWRNDSLQIYWSNPRHLPIQWSIKTTNGNIESSVSDEASIIVNLPENQHKRQLWLYYSYPWGGRTKQFNQDLKALNDQLEVSLETPAKIYPGQTENITIQVKDARGNPVSGTAITAAAYNAQFRKNAPYQISSIQFKGRRKPFTRQRYALGLSNAVGSVPLNRKWHKRLELDQYLYYRIRYPAAEGLFEYRSLNSKDSLAQETAQIAPFLTKDGQLSPVYLIYLDNRLMYYHKAWKNTPYSIVAEPGYHQLTLRTKQGEVRMDSVLLKAGQILDWSIDLGRFNSDLITYHASSKFLSRQEIALIEKQTFYMRPLNRNSAEQFLYQDPRHIYTLDAPIQRDFAWGLFQNGKEIIWLKPGLDTTSFRFESGFSYQISKTRDRLYQHKPLSRSKKTAFPNSLSHPLLKQEAIFLADIKTPIEPWHYDFISPPSEKTKNRGSLTLFSGNIKVWSKGIIVSKNDESIYLLPSHQSTIVLPQGQYTLSWVMNNDSTLLEKEIYIQARHLQALNLTSQDMEEQMMDKETLDFLESRKRRGNTRGVRNPNRLTNNSPYKNIGRLISGVITTGDGEALIGASILLDGTSIGTVTDIDGYYELWVPFDGGEITISYLGFTSFQSDLGANDTMNITLEESGLLLSEVIVTGYLPGVQKSSTTQAVEIRGTRSDASIYYIDGVAISSEEIRNLPTRNINALAATTAGLSSIDSDGSRGEEEDIGFALGNIDLPLDSIRDSFRDYAYWQPTLTTNSQGKVTFAVTFPDDITNWRHFALAMDRRARLGVSEGFTAAYLPLQAQLYTPRFLVEDDRSSVRGVLTNRSGQSLEVATYLQQKDGKREERQSLLELSAKEVFDLETVPTGIDTLEYTYGLQSGEYRDGEVRQIPVFPIGSKRTVGGYMVLNDNKVYSIETDPLYGPVDLLIGGNGLPQLIKEISWLRNYRYGCNEQTASRLMALLAIKQLPEVEAMTKGDIEDAVDLEKAILGMIHRLDNNRYVDGNWGWWKSSNRASIWITQHVLNAFQKAESMDYTVPDVTLAERYLLGKLTEQTSHQRLESLLFFAERGQVLEYEDYLQEYDTLSRPFTWELSYRRIQQLQAIPYQLDSLSKYAQHTLTGARYWGKPQFWHFRPSRQAVDMTLQAYQLYRDADLMDSVVAIQQYFMEDDPFYPRGAAKDHWAINTYEASQMTEILLPDLLGADGEFQVLTVTVSQVNQSLDTIHNFPKKLQLLPIPQANISLEKNGDGPAFVSYYQTYWDRDPLSESNGFTIKTGFNQNHKNVDQLALNESAQLSISVKLEADADYVMIEIPVPAGCSYGDKLFNQGRYETHREYRRDRVVIFLETLPQGEHLFSINLEPRFAGTYTMNPARVEMMYIPSFNGSTEVKKVEIK